MKFCLNGLQIDMLFGKLSDASKLLSFQQKTTSPLLSQPADEPRREYHIDDTDFEGMVRCRRLLLVLERPCVSHRCSLFSG